MKNVMMWLVAVALMCSAALGQTVSKNEVLLSAGKSDKVTISVPGCTPNWTVTSDNMNVTVTPDSVVGKEKVNFTIRADSGAFSEEASVTVLIDDPDCLNKQLEVVIPVYVVMDAKVAERTFSKGSKNLGLEGVKGHQKTLKNELKAAQKDFDAEMKQILKDAQAGTLVAPEDAGEPGSQWDVAFVLIALLIATSFGRMFTAYRTYMGAIASDGRSVLSFYGFLPLLLLIAPLGFSSGGCGEWDNARFAGFALLVAALGGLTGSVKKNEKKLAKALAIPIVFGITPFFMVDFSGAIPDPTSSSAGDVSELDVEVRIAQLTAYHGAQLVGTEEMDVNTFTVDRANGRIAAIGRAPAGSTVNVVASNDSIGDGIGAVGSATADDDGFWFILLPGANQPPSLVPGRYEVRATVGDDSDVNSVVVPSSVN